MNNNYYHLNVVCDKLYIYCLLSAYYVYLYIKLVKILYQYNILVYYVLSYYLPLMGYWYWYYLCLNN